MYQINTFILLILSLTFFCITTSQAQNLILFEDETTGMFGYKDEKGKTILEAKYFQAYPFEKGKAIVADQKQGWIYINEQGKTVLRPFVYDNGPDYLQEGRSRIIEKDKIGFLNTEGAIVIEPQYDFAFPFDGGYSVICQGCKAQSTETEYFEIKGGKWGAINRHNTLVLPLEYRNESEVHQAIYESETDHSEYFSPFLDEETDLMGFADDKGEIILAAQYPLADQFRYGLAAVVDQEEGWVYINTLGEIEMVPFVFDNGPDYFEDERSRIIENGKIGFINTHMEVVIEPVFDFALPFDKGYAIVCEGCREKVDNPDDYTSLVGGKWGAIDTSGKIVVPIEEKDDITVRKKLD